MLRPLYFYIYFLKIFALDVLYLNFLKKYYVSLLEKLIRLFIIFHIHFYHTYVKYDVVDKCQKMD